MTRERTKAVAVASAPILRCALAPLRGSGRFVEHLVEGDLFRIGKNPDNDLVLTDATVSRHHCEIKRDARGWLVRDLGSTNGTVLDGAEVKEAYLKNGAIVSIGSTDFKVRLFSDEKEIPINLDAIFVPTKTYREMRAEWDELFERRFIVWILERHKGNVSAAARETEMDRKYLHRLAKKHGLK